MDRSNPYVAANWLATPKDRGGRTPGALPELPTQSLYQPKSTRSIDPKVTEQIMAELTKSGKPVGVGSIIAILEALQKSNPADTAERQLIQEITGMPIGIQNRMPGVRGVGQARPRSATPAAGSLDDYQTQLANNRQQSMQQGRGNPVPVGQQIGGTSGYQSIAGNTPNWTANFGARSPSARPMLGSGSTAANPAAASYPMYQAPQQATSAPAPSQPSQSSPSPATSSNGIWTGGTQSPSQTPQGYPVNNLGASPTPPTKPPLPGQNNPDGSQQGGYGSPPFVPVGSSFGNSAFPNVPNAGGASPYQTGFISNDATASNGKPLEAATTGISSGDVMFGSGVPGAVGGDAGGSIGQWPTTPQMVANGVDPRFAFGGGMPQGAPAFGQYDSLMMKLFGGQ